MNFSEKIQNKRKEKGLTQEQFAELLNVSRQAVSKWESGQSYPEVEKLIKISDLFEITLDDLIKDKKIKSNCNNDEYEKEDEDDISTGLIIGCFTIGMAIGLITENYIWGIFSGFIGIGLSYIIEEIRK